MPRILRCFGNNIGLAARPLASSFNPNLLEKTTIPNTMIMEIVLLIVIIFIAYAFRNWEFKNARTKRRDYYRNVYLKSDAWQRKRYVVLKRDHWTCVYCGAQATQVHHLRYAKYNIGKEPIKWLVSICKSCHDKKHTHGLERARTFFLTQFKCLF